MIRGRSVLAAVALMTGIATSASFVGAQSSLGLRAGHGVPSAMGDGKRRRSRADSAARQDAAQAKRERRQARNLRWAAAGGIQVI